MPETVRMVRAPSGSRPARSSAAAPKSGGADHYQGLVLVLVFVLVLPVTGSWTVFCVVVVVFMSAGSVVVVVVAEAPVVTVGFVLVVTVVELAAGGITASGVVVTVVELAAGGAAAFGAVLTVVEVWPVIGSGAVVVVVVVWATAADAKVRAAPIIRVRIVSLLLWSCWRQERKRRRYVPLMGVRRSQHDGGAAA